jgi:hypothetical protein
LHPVAALKMKTGPIFNGHKFCAACGEQFEVWSCTILQPNLGDECGLEGNNKSEVKAIKNPSHCPLLLQSIPSLDVS